MNLQENKKSVVIRNEEEEVYIPQGKNYLLIIGIGEYEYCPTLYNAVKDAKDLLEVLVNRFQFELENVKTLFNQDATKRNIYKAFEFYAKKVTPKDNFLLYFSGHGEFKKLFNLGYWIPVEAKIDAIHEFIPNSEVKNILSAIKSHHTFLMVDSCFSGALFAKNTRNQSSFRKERDPSRWCLTAGRNEIVTDGFPGQNSPFAESILYQLRKTIRSLGVSELCNSVLELVITQSEQTPRGEPLKIDGHKGGQFVFYLKDKEALDWKEAKAKDNQKSYSNYLKQYPNGGYSEKARRKLEIIAWTNIKRKNEKTLSQINSKISSIMDFLENHPNASENEAATTLREKLFFKQNFFPFENSSFDYTILTKNIKYDAITSPIIRLENLLKVLDEFYYLHKLKFLTEKVTRKKVLNSSSRKQLSDFFVPDNILTSSPLIEIYHLHIQLLTTINPELKENAYNRLKKIYL